MPSTVCAAPNPFAKTTTIVSEIAFYNADLIITNTQGQIVRKIRGIKGKSIPILKENLPDGIYYLKIVEGSNILSTKLIISAAF